MKTPTLPSVACRVRAQADKPYVTVCAAATKRFNLDDSRHGPGRDRPQARAVEPCGTPYVRRSRYGLAVPVITSCPFTIWIWVMSIGSPSLDGSIAAPICALIWLLIASGRGNAPVWICCTTICV